MPEKAHAKHFVIDEEGWDKMAQDEDFWKYDLFIEEIIPHDEDLLIKWYWVTFNKDDQEWNEENSVLFWRINNSIPSKYLNEK